MALDPALESELRVILRSFRAAHGAAAMPGGSGKALEAWLLMKLAETARATGSWDVALFGGDGLQLPPGSGFLMRNQPGPIASSVGNAPGFVRLAHRRNLDPKLILELHGGLQWLGRSDALHECDVSLLPEVIGKAIRTSGGGCPSGLPIAALECKDKTSPGSADEMRQTLARLFDLAYVSQTPLGGATRIFHLVSKTAWGRRSSKYVSFFATVLFGIVRVGTFQAGARKLGRYYSINRYDKIYDPGSPAVSQLQGRFAEVLASVDSLTSP